MQTRIRSVFYSTLFLARLLFIGDFLILPVVAATSVALNISQRPTQAEQKLAVRPVPEYQKGEVIIQFASGIRPSTSQVGTQRLAPAATPPTDPSAETVTPPEYWRVKIDSPLPMEEVIAILKEDPRIVSVEPNIIRRSTVTPNDPELSLQWYLTNESSGIKTLEAWDTQTGSKEVVVAVIDTGVDLDHPDLADNIWVNSDEIPDNNKDDDGNGYVDDVHGYNFADGNGDPTPIPDGVDNDNYAGADTGTTHGTHVAGTIAAAGNNGVGISGVTWHTSIMAMRALDDEGAGLDSNIVAGIYYAVDNGAHIINMSLGGFGSTEILKTAVEYAVSKGVLIVAAAGNNGINIDRYPFYPVCYEGVLGVGSTGTDNQASTFSNYGLNCVDLSAPGENIYSTIFTNDAAHGFSEGYSYMSGTSMAAPVVAGVAVLVKAARPALTRAQLIEVITTSAVDVKLANVYGSGRLDANQALLGIDNVDRPEAPVRIRAYANSQKQQEYSSSKRYNDPTPYFTWSAGSDDDGIAGYYVYFGPERTASPINKGIFQVSRSYQAEKVEANNQPYYLRVISEDTKGNTSLDVTTFKYVVDTRVRQIKRLILTRQDDAIEVRWPKVQNEFVREYQVWRAAPTADEIGLEIIQWQQVAVLDRQIHDYIDTNVNPGMEYKYRVQALDNLGNKSKSQRRPEIFFVPRERVAMAAGAGYEPYVRVYNTETGLYEQTWRAYGASERAGLEIAVGNLDDDRYDEIVVAMGAGVEPRVKVVDPNGTELASFLAYESSFRGGVRLSVGDFDNDGEEEIVTVPGADHTPEVKVFDRHGVQKWPSFLALDQKFKGGAFVTAIDWGQQGQDEIAVTAGPGGGTEIIIYQPKDGTALAIFKGYDAGFKGGTRLSAWETVLGMPQVLLTVPATGNLHVKSFAADQGGAKQLSPGFMAFADYHHGGTIAAGDTKARGADRLIIGSGGESVAEVRIYNKSGSKLRHTIQPFGENQIPVQVAAGWLK